MIYESLDNPKTKKKSWQINSIQKRPLRFRPVYLVSSRVSLPWRRRRSFFCIIQSRDFFSGLPRAALAISLFLIYAARLLSSVSSPKTKIGHKLISSKDNIILEIIPNACGSCADPPVIKTKKYFFAFAELG